VSQPSQPALPTGTVTFLFTDIEGSTRLLLERGSQYAELLEEHRRILREAFTGHDGVEMGTEGDAFFVAFPSASGAVAAAVEGTRGLEGGPIRVRIGIHTGEPIVTDGNYIGIDVHRAARIGSAAHGGQIVISGTTRSLLDDVSGLRDLGEHRLKDMVAAERLYQVGDGEFPPLRSLDTTNLPVVTSTLVGREREIGELTGLLSGGTHLVTITGPGGAGKTRLALQVTAELVGAIRDGVYWVPLGAVTDPELVSSEVARVVGAPEDLSAFLRGKALLILLDNFEHLLDAAPAVAGLVSASDGVRVLITSRSPLHVSGERDYRLEPLPATQAAELFVERAEAVGRQLTPDRTIEAICVRLDGLPLAIELAAARTKLIAPERLLERLDSALPLLTAGPRDAPERQRTLRATIEWSHELLDAESQELFARCAVFAGSFTLTAAEEVCDADLDVLATLVDSSLLTPSGDDRFLMLATIREFALERLASAPNAEELLQRHAAHYSDLAEEAYAHRFDAEAEWASQLELDHGNLRAALSVWNGTDPHRALELAGALGWFWLSHGYFVEGRAHLTDALERSQERGAARARALTSAGRLVGRGGDAAMGRQLVSEGVDLWRDLARQDELASALDGLGWLLTYDAGDDDAALEAFERSLELRRELADRPGETRALVGVCQVLIGLGEVERAESLSRELQDRADGDRRIEHFAFHFLADCALIRGDTRAADDRYQESLQAALPLGDVVESSYEIQGIAMASAIEDPRRALRLAAAVETLHQSLGLPPGDTFWEALLERYIGRAREALGDEADPVWAEGLRLTFDDAVDLAMHGP
jgi:predicted ATPase/class 3 adenylate cyclase